MKLKIGLVGKYVELHDAYKSIAEAFIHAGTIHECKVKIDWIHSERLEADEDKVEQLLDGLDGILVAPGFGERGIEGKINAAKYARENKVPFFGICLGMQCACVEFARNVLGYEEASSAEMNPDTPHPIIDLMEDQVNLKQMGGTMRLGAYSCKLSADSKLISAYQNDEISERHRHRYEFNNRYIELFEQHGMIAAGINPEKNLVEIVELQRAPLVYRYPISP